MEKTKLGINPAFYAVLAYVLVMFDSRLMLLGLVLFVIVAEKNDWVTKHVVQALALSYIISIFWLICYSYNPVDLLIDFVMKFTYDIAALLISVQSGFYKFMEVAIYVILIIFAISAAKGKEAKIPLVSKFSNFALGIKKEAKAASETKEN